MTDVQTQPDAMPIVTDVVSANGNKAAGATGTILQITGPVVDVQFPADMLPEIYNALEVTRDDGSILTLETQSHLGNDAVRAIAMSTTDGLRRGATVQDMGGPITVPVGPETLGRILNVVGEPIDEAGPVNATTRYPDPPAGAALRGPGDHGRGLRDRHQSHRPHRSVHPGRQDRRLRRRRRRQDRHHHRADPQHRGRARRILRVRRRGRAHPRRHRSSGARCRSRVSPTRRCSSSAR